MTTVDVDEIEELFDGGDWPQESGTWTQGAASGAVSGPLYNEEVIGGGADPTLDIRQATFLVKAETFTGLSFIPLVGAIFDATPAPGRKWQVQSVQPRARDCATNLPTYYRMELESEELRGA